MSMDTSSGNKTKETVCAVVVTYNRKNLLLECLEALLKQTRPPDEIIVIDNASIDGTDHIIRSEFPQVTYIRLPKNTGGAGGFYEGIKLACEKRYDWVWVMDDDAIPMPDALEKLLTSLNLCNDCVGLLCSNVIWMDGYPHIMNVPQISTLIPSKEGTVPFNQLINYGLIRIYACSFVSVLISSVAINTVGLPIKEMFIYGDDIEFTNRVSKCFPCYYVPNSNVLHKTKYNFGTDIETATSDKVWSYYFQTRNIFYLRRQRGTLSMLKYCLIDWPHTVYKALKRKSCKFYAVWVLTKGLIAGIFFNPKIKTIERTN